MPASPNRFKNMSAGRQVAILLTAVIVGIILVELSLSLGWAFSDKKNVYARSQQAPPQPLFLKLTPFTIP